MTTSGYIRTTALSLLIIIASAALHSCQRDDENLDNCSGRGKPQKWDGQKWSCK